MGLGNWINRNIVEYQPADPPPKPDDPPEERAKRVELVPVGKAKDLIEELPKVDFGELDLDALSAPPSTSEPGESDQPAGTADSGPVETADEGLATPPPDPLDDGGDPPVSIPQVYEASHIDPPKHGFTLAKLAGMLADPRMAKLDVDSRASAIAVVLEASGVKLATVVQDAATRDQALDQFEGYLATKLVDRQVETDQRVERLEQEIKDFAARKEAEIELIQQRLREKQVELARFRRVKRQEELRLLEVVRHFTTEPTISVGDERVPTHPGGDDTPTDVEG